MAARLKASDAAIDPFNTAHKPTGFKTTDLSKILRACAHLRQSKTDNSGSERIWFRGPVSLPKNNLRISWCWLLASQ